MNKLILLNLLFLSSCGFMKQPSHFFSKEACSCLFVEKQSKEYCLKYAKVSIPVWGFEIDEKNKTVSSNGYFRSTSAKFISEKLGCQVTD